jgi:hypothetical protein
LNVHCVLTVKSETADRFQRAMSARLASDDPNNVFFLCVAAASYATGGSGE